MLARISHTRLLRYAGLFTWAMVGLPLVYSWVGPLLGTAGDDELALRPMPWQGWIAYLAFGLSYAWLTRGLGSRARSVGDYILLHVGFALGKIDASVPLRAAEKYRLLDVNAGTTGGAGGEA